MPGSCEVCSTEPSKYKCPTCGLMSCSLACTQSHKVYCAPKAPSTREEPAEPSSPTQVPPVQNGHHSHGATDGADDQQKKFSPATIASSPELKEFFTRYPELRDQLYDMYRSTLEDEWVEWYTPPARGRGHGRGGKMPARRSRGPWTAEKGFNRGLGRVRKLRQDCEDGTEAGKKAEAFMQFLALVNGRQGQHGSSEV